MRRWAGATDPPAVADVLSTYEGGLAFDVGANCGQSAQVLARHFDEVVSFEPCRESFDILADEAPANVATRCLALSDTTGPLELLEAAESIATGQLVSFPGLHWGSIQAKREVPAATLDAMADVFGPPDFVKVDTEGHEAKVLAGARQTIATYMPRFLIEIHSRRNYNPIRRALATYTLEVIEHPALVNSAMRHDHYWLRCEP